MSKWYVVALVSSLFVAGPGLLAQDQGGPPEIVERVEVINNRYLQTETLLYYISTKPGDRLDRERLKKDFQRLWDTGFLDDLWVEVVNGQQGMVVRFRVVERKRIQLVDYRGIKDISKDDIDEAVGQNDLEIRIDTFYDPAKARRVEGLIEMMLSSKGRPFAKVTHETRNIGGSGQQISFIVDEGPKAKIRTIEFEGNEVYSDSQLRGKLDKMKPAGLWNLSWLGGKTTYTEEKWLGGPEDPQGDRGRLEDFYLNNGYVAVRIGLPRIEYYEEEGAEKNATKWMRIVIPVDEGDQYKLGEMTFEGLTVFKEEYVRASIKLSTGEIYNESRFKKAFEQMRELYGSLGYFQWTGSTDRTPDPDKKVVDVVVRMEEDLQYFVGQINFIGNDTTKDKVIRREIFMNEAAIFNTDALKMSVQRINQLGYFKPIEGAPDIRPNPDEENLVDVTFRVEEQNRNQFTFGGGVSGLEGTFINGSFSTTNFLGAGETLSVYVQSGRRTKNYSLSISEPYFLDRPITAGADVFKREITYLSIGSPGFTQSTTGFSLTTGRQVGRWSRLFLNYAYEIIEISEVSASEFANDPFYPGFGGGVNIGSIDPQFFGDAGQRTESRITPNLLFNTVNNPFTPTRGRRHSASMMVAGGPLGGTVSYFRPNFETILYIPFTGKTSLGLRGQVSWILPYGDTRTLPLYQRYYVGGETQVRGYPIRSIGPTDSTGRAVGGNKLLLLNAEYYWDVFGPLRMIAFVDAGQAYLEGERMRLDELKISYGLEARFIMPILNVPFRLIYAFNPNRSAFEELYVQSSVFKFAVGTTF